MPKTPDKLPSPAIERTPSKEGWFSRNRGKLALVFGLTIGGVIGGNYKRILRSYQDEQRHDIWWTLREARAKKLTTSKPDPVRDEISGMPSLCELREGTFLADSRGLNEQCEKERLAPQECSCSTPIGQEAWNSTMADIKAQAITFVQCESKGHELEGNCGLRLKREVSRENYRALEDIPDSYRTLMKEFNPELYVSLGKLAYIRDNDSELEGKVLGITDQPYDLFCGYFVPAKCGQFHLINLAGELRDIDIEQAFGENDEAEIRQFVNNMNVLAHEIYGHARTNEHAYGQCTAEGLVASIKDELYAYYVGSKMTAFMVRRYPALCDQFKKDEAEFEGWISRLKEVSLCETDLETIEQEAEEMEKTSLVMEAELYRAYSEAEKTGDWTQFKDLIFNDVILGNSDPSDPYSHEYSGLPYIFANFRAHGKQEEVIKMDGQLRGIMNEESPEKLLEKK